MACRCYHAYKNFLGETGVCWGTKEGEACSCDGDEARCDFYDYVRKRARKQVNNGDRFRSMTDEELADMFACDVCPNHLGDSTWECAYDYSETSECRQCWLDWLRQEYKEE